MIASPYKSLVEASSSLADIEFFDFIDADNVEQAGRLLKSVGPVLDLARQCLKYRCEVPVEYEADFFSRHMDDLQDLRNLSRGFRMESDIAAFSEDYASVARVGTDILELANAARRGGLIVDLLVGIAISGIAIDCLRKSRHKFSSDTQARLTAALLRYENEREPFEDIVRRDARWEEVAGFDEEAGDISDFDFTAAENGGLSEVEQQELVHFVQYCGDRPEHERHGMYLAQDRHGIALTRMLVVDLALRNWHASKESFPPTLSDLSPAFLADVPLDPFTNADFIYRADTSDLFTLYSTGPDAVDAGGRFAPWCVSCDGGFDLCLDAEDLWADCCAIPEQVGIIGRLGTFVRSWRHRWEYE